MCLNIGVTILPSTTEIKRVIPSQYNIDYPVWIANDSMYHQISLVFLTYSYKDCIYPSVGTNSTVVCIFTLQNNVTSRRV